MVDTALNGDAIVTKNEDVLFSEVADGMSLMDIESGNYFHFDQTGAHIWKQLDGTTKVSTICAKLEEEFDVDPQVCAQETIEFLGELLSLDLVSPLN